VSRVGRTRTAPAHAADVARLRLGVVSCANLQAGWFSAYRHLAARDDLDAVLHLGDYLYEYAPGEYGLGQGNVDVRRHVPAREIVGLSDYRRRHAQYKRDADLANLPARFPFIVTWDDHESANDAWCGGAENHTPGVEGRWHARRAAAYRAYDEWMPARLGGTAVVGDGARSTGGCASGGSRSCPCSTCGPTATSRWTPTSAPSTTRSAASPAPSSWAGCNAAWPPPPRSGS